MHRTPTSCLSRFAPLLLPRLGISALLLAVLLALPAALAQNTIHVPQDKPTIQGAIDAAQNGDTVLVSPGTYAVALDFQGKAITVTSGATSYDAPAVAATTLIPTHNNLGDDPVAVFLHYEGRGSVLNGFTIRDSVQPWYHTVFTGGEGFNIASVLWTNSFATPSITNNRFINDTTVVEVAGGLIAGNDFSHCLGDYLIYLGLQNPNLANTANAEISGNLFEDNSPAFAVIEPAGAVIEKNILRGNQVAASPIAGTQTNNAVFALGPNVALLNNLVYDNQFTVLIQASGEPGTNNIVANNTFANNTAAPSCTGSCPLTDLLLTKTAPHDGNGLLLANNIFQTPAPGPYIACFDGPGGPFLPSRQDTLQLDHNLFSPSAQPILDPSCRLQITNAGNLVADPGFANPAADDFHLQAGSPAVDAGNNSILGLLSSVDALSLTADFDGNPRPVDATGRGYPVIDIGAFEYPGVVAGAPTSLVLSPSTYAPTLASKLTLTATLSSALGTPQGTVTLSEDGKPAGSATVRPDGTAVFSPSFASTGVHEFIATYPGNASFAPATSLKLVLSIEQVATFLSLSASPSSAEVGSAIALSIQTGAADGSVPSPITLTDNGNPLATLVPNASGQATLSVTTFSAGTHNLVARYPGTTLYAPAAATSSVVLYLHDFSIGLNPTFLTLRSGQQGTISVQLASIGDFAGALNLTASQVPAHASFSFSPSTVALTSGAPANATLLINTLDLPAMLAKPQSQRGPLQGPGAPLLALAILPFLAKRPRRLSACCAALAASVLFISSTGCTDVREPLLTLAPGTYLVPVTATDPSTQITHSAMLTLVITQ